MCKRGHEKVAPNAVAASKGRGLLRCRACEAAITHARTLLERGPDGRYDDQALQELSDTKYQQIMNGTFGDRTGKDGNGQAVNLFKPSRQVDIPTCGQCFTQHRGECL